MNSTTVTYANFRAVPPLPLPKDEKDQNVKIDPSNVTESQEETSQMPKNISTFNTSPSNVVPSAIHGSLPRRRNQITSQFHQTPTCISNSNNSPSQQQASTSMTHSSMGHVRTYVRSPGSVITAVTPTPMDEDFIDQMSREELIARMRAIEAKNRKLIFDNGQMMKDLNQHLSQLQSLKHHNFQLMTDNNELRDLCCYLDDERSKARILAREWQTFGNHMSRVMKHEVSTYAKKLQQLEQKQFELVRENFELRQLCILLDNAINIRENGDGSTGSMSSSNDQDNSQQSNGPPNTDTAARINSLVSSTNNGNICSSSNSNSTSRSSLSHKGLINHQILQYIGSLEKRVEELEREKNQLLCGKSQANGCDDSFSRRQEGTKVGKHSTANHMEPSFASTSRERAVDVPDSVLASSSSRSIPVPPVVADAMRVLRIKESLVTCSSRSSSDSKGKHQLESNQQSNSQQSNSSSNTAGVEASDISNEQQKSIVRSLCHVAWKKIEDRS